MGEAQAMSRDITREVKGVFWDVTMRLGDIRDIRGHQGGQGSHGSSDHVKGRHHGGQESQGG